MEKKTYYVNLGSGEISQIKYSNNSVFTIQATEDEVQNLRSKLDEMDAGNISAYARAHVPILSYHKDSGNDQYDEGIEEAFQIIYDLGNQETKQHIDEMGVLGDRPM